MIKIFSISNDHTTNVVIDWLDYYKANWSRINAEDIENSTMTNLFDIEKAEDKPKIVWFRKWEKAINAIKATDKDYLSTANVGKEFEELSKSLYHKYDSAKWLNQPADIQFDKISQLLLAKKIGLAVPPTAIVSDKKELLRFKRKNKNIITKPLAAVIHKREANKSYINYTRRIEDDEIENLEDNFYPTLIQKEVKKEFEIRIFYLDGDFYSMAIFSQNDERTSLDFRHYNMKKQNRRVSFKLPTSVTKKLDVLMKESNINCGSIDLIKEEGGEYVFLEVNPLGQFGMVSLPCNYFLEEKVAELLIKTSNE